MDKYQEIKMRSKMPEDVIKEVSDYIKVLNEDMEYYRKLYLDYNKDKEISALKNEINRLNENSLIILSDKQKQQRREFTDNHYEMCKQFIFEYIVTPTGIGDGDYTPMHTETIEGYDSMDYKIEEMVERFKVVCKVLKEKNSWDVY